MILPKCGLLLGIILTLLLDPISSKRSFGGSHSYPKSGGLSGGGHRGGGLSGGGRGYPSSGGGHGYPSSGGSHGYPSSGGMSGGSHGYPSSGGSQYPSSGGGSHGYPSSGHSGGAGNPVGGSHAYPSSGNNHGYPASTGLSGGGRGYPSNKPAGGHTTTNVHNNYHYNPPAQISYASPHGGATTNYPVYRGAPPQYVYQYKDSGSKYGTLLAGLALMNLGTLGVAGYAAYQATHNHGSSGSSGSPVYRAQPGEVCKFAVKKENGDYEETKIDCQIISGFILQDMQAQSAANNSTITTTTTVTNVTIVNNTASPDQTTTSAPVLGNVLYAMLPNGTLVPVNATGVDIPGVPAVANATQNETAPVIPGPPSVSTVTTTTTNTTLVSALDVKGDPVKVTPGMQCFLIRNSPTSNMRKSVPCGVLQTYADKSISRNVNSFAGHNVPMFTMLAAVLAYCIA